MRQLGLYLLIFGIASIVLYFLNMNLRILMWIDLWGPTVGWLIRGGLVVGGIVLMAVSPGDSEENA